LISFEIKISAIENTIGMSSFGNVGGKLSRAVSIRLNKIL
jgi:hypothetical protein